MNEKINKWQRKLKSFDEHDARTEFFRGKIQFALIYLFGISSICCDFSTHIAHTSTCPETLFAWSYRQRKAHSPAIALCNFFFRSLFSVRCRIRQEKKYVFIPSWGFCFSMAKNTLQRSAARTAAHISHSHFLNWIICESKEQVWMSSIYILPEYETNICTSYRQSIKSILNLFAICMRHTEIIVNFHTFALISRRVSHPTEN